MLRMLTHLGLFSKIHKHSSHKMLSIYRIGNCISLVGSIDNITDSKCANFQVIRCKYLQPLKKEQLIKKKEFYTPEVRFPTKFEIASFEKKDFPCVHRYRWLVPFRIFNNRIEKIKIGDGLVSLYENLVDEVNVQEFFDDFLLPNTFQSWFLVMELHVYLLCCRIMQEEYKYNVITRDALIDHFWDDVGWRIDKLDANMSSKIKRKSLQALFFQFQAAVYGYDEGLQSSDRVLAAAVWRRIFFPEYCEAVSIERLVKYMRVQMHYLSHLTWDDLLFTEAQLTIPLAEVMVYDYY